VRTTYRVTDPERLRRYVAGRLPVDELLSADELTTLLKAAARFRDAGVRAEGAEFDLVLAGGSDFDRSWDFLRKVTEVLRKVGWEE
jgi:hypothetical protein